MDSGCFAAGRCGLYAFVVAGTDSIDSADKAQGSASVHRALKILKCFGGDAKQMRLSDIAHETGLSISTVHRLLGALVADGFVVQNSETEKYELGPEVIRLGVRSAYEADEKHVRAVLDALAARTGESAALSYRVAGKDQGLVAECTPSTQRLRFDHELGSIVALHASAMGKVILAFGDSDLAATVRNLGVLEKFTEKTRIGADLEHDLEEVRSRGWSFNDGERYDGVVGVAAPVFDATGKFVAAVGIQGPEVRVQREQVVSVVLQAATDLNGRVAAR